MNKVEKIENRERNIKLEFIPGIIALITSLIFVFSNHIGRSYQIYYVIIVFATHQICQAIIFNRWNFSSEHNSKKIWTRISIITLALIVVFFDLGRIISHNEFHFGFTNDKPRNTFISVVIYWGVYFILYYIGLKRFNKKH